jgi:hypothetical protein
VCHVAVVAARPVEQLLAAAGPGVCVLTLLHGGQVGSGVLVLIQVPAGCTPTTHTRITWEGHRAQQEAGPRWWDRRLQYAAHVAEGVGIHAVVAIMRLWLR